RRGTGKVFGGQARQFPRHVEAAIGRQSGIDRVAETGRLRPGACADKIHRARPVSSAAGPFTGETKLSLAIPSCLNASRIEIDAAAAAAIFSNQANTLGPAPEMLAPIAP